MQSENQHIIDLQAVETAQNFTFRLDDSFFAMQDQDEILGGDVKVEVALTPVMNDFRMHIAAEGSVQVRCDRCLEPMTLSVSTEEEDVVKRGNGEDEDGLIWVHDDQLELQWLLFEIVETCLPIVHSHQNGECNPEMEKLLLTHLCTAADPEE